MIDFRFNTVNNEALNVDLSFLNELAVFLRLEETSETDILDLKSRAARLLKFNNLVVFAIGGSCLGGKLLASFGRNKNKKVTFYDTIDENILIPQLEILNLKETAILFISKSGSTLETVLQYKIISDIYSNKIVNFQDNFFFITERDSYLYDIAKKIKSDIFEFSNEIGGRYSCFTASTFLPAIFVDVDINRYILGAQFLLQELKGGRQQLLSSIQICLRQSLESKIFSVISYSERLSIFNEWYKQLLAESSGKNQKGITPITSTGTRDQHSMLQLFLDGPNDKFHTVISILPSEKSRKVQVNSDDRFAFLNQHSMSSIFYTNSMATFNALTIQSRIARLITLEELNEYSIGYLNAYFIVENIAICKTLEVDPFDQPSVEIIKQEVKRMLSIKKI